MNEKENFGSSNYAELADILIKRSPHESDPANQGDEKKEIIRILQILFEDGPKSYGELAQIFDKIKFENINAMSIMGNVVTGIPAIAGDWHKPISFEDLLNYFKNENSR